MMEVVFTLAGPLAATLAVVFLALGARHVVRSRQGEGAADGRPELGHKPSRDHCHDVALWCLRQGRLAEAQDLFLRAGEPGRAAQVATRLGHHRLAGALYETAGELLRAATAFEQAGMTGRANELRAAGQLAEAPTSRYLALDMDRPQRILRAGHGGITATPGQSAACGASTAVGAVAGRTSEGEGRGAKRGVREAWAALRAALPLGASGAPSPGLARRPGAPGGPSAGVVWDTSPPDATGGPTRADVAGEVRRPATATGPSTHPSARPATPARHRPLSPFGALLAVARGGGSASSLRPRRPFEDSWDVLMSGEPACLATPPAPQSARRAEPPRPASTPRTKDALALDTALATRGCHDAGPRGQPARGLTTRDYCPSSIPPSG